MEVRCGSCSKLFRVSDDKITPHERGIKFKCTRCSEYVKITREDFERYQLSSATATALDSFAPKPSKTPAASREPSPHPEEKGFVLSGPSIDKIPVEEKISAAPEPKPAVQPEPRPTVKPAPGPSIDLEPILTSSAPPEEEISEPVSSSKSVPAPEKPAPAAAEKPSELPGAPFKPAAAARAIQDTIHPFVSGATAGALGGFISALPVLGVLIFGLGILSAYLSKYIPNLLSGGLSGSAVLYSAAAFIAGFMGLGILIGVVLAVIQSGARIKIFSFLGVLIGTFLGALIGAGKGLTMSMVSEVFSGSLLSLVMIVPGAVVWGLKALLVSIFVVIMRRTVVSSKRESFSASLSGIQILGMLLFAAIFGYTVYGEVMNVAQTRAAHGDMEKRTEELRAMYSPEGLQITNPSGYMDSNGDLVITGVIENAADKERPNWYIVADVLDAQGNALIQAKMLNNNQLYTAKDYEILTRRGANIQDVMSRAMERQQAAVIPARGMVNFEIRIMEPPIGIASFNVTLQQFNPAQQAMQQLNEMKGKLEEYFKQQQQQQR